MAQNRNSRLKPSAILDRPIRKPDFWPMGLTAVAFPSAYRIWCKNVDWRPNYGPISKFISHLGFTKIWFLCNGSHYSVDFPSGYQIWCKNVDRRPNWTKIKIQDGGYPPSWIFQNLISDQWVSLGRWFSILIPNLVQKCRSTPKLWPKIEIKDGGRPPSWIFENLISDQWVALGFWFSFSVRNLVQKCWSTPKLWPKI